MTRITLPLVFAVALHAGSVVAQQQTYVDNGYATTVQSAPPVQQVLPMTAPGVPAGQVGMPGMQFSTSIAAGDGGQLFPYDRQDPWIHGHFQRVPAYGGFASFRPYNYRHVLSQTQLSSAWGMPRGMPYSQQFWNKYRTGYLNGDIHSPRDEASLPPEEQPARGLPASNASYPVRLPTQGFVQPQQTLPPQRPVHVYPQR